GRRLADADCPMDFSMLAELRNEGVTDYVASPLLFTDGEIHLATWTTRQPGGFRDAQIEAIESIVAPLARVPRAAANRGQAGERILAGEIRRGHAEAIHAAIWLSDMRGFTLLADRVPAQTLVELLNDYFDCQVPAILEHDGEVLKFMGDGLLAISALVTRVCGDAGASKALRCRGRMRTTSVTLKKGVPPQPPFET